MEKRREKRANGEETGEREGDRRKTMGTRECVRRIRGVIEGRDGWWSV